MEEYLIALTIIAIVFIVSFLLGFKQGSKFIWYGIYCGTGNKRDYEATHSIDCPHKLTERKRKKKTTKEPKNQLKIDFKL